MKIRCKIILYFIVFITLTCALAYNFWFILDNSNQLNKYQQQRYKSHHAAEQLRRNSDELTRMARTYIMTGDTRFKELDKRTFTDINDLQIQQAHIFNRVLIIMTIMIFFSFLGYFYFKYSILTPLNSLLSAVKKMQTGSYDLQLSDQGNNEVSELYHSFIVMANSIQTSMEEKQTKLKDSIKNEKEMTAMLRHKAQLLDFQQNALNQHAIVSITDLKGNITYVNDKFSEISQYTKKELLGKNHRLLHSNYHPDSFFQEMWETISSGHVWQGQIQNRAKGGSLYWVASTIVPYMNEQGKPEQYIAIRTDITQVKHTDERLRITIEATGDAVWDWNIITGEFNVSTIYATMLGYQPEELAPHIDTWINSVHPDDIARIQTNLQTYLHEKKGIYQVELRLRCKDNSWKWVLCRGEIITTDNSGNPVEMTGLHTDISARKAMELELLQGKEVAEKANKAKSEFLSSMSHELRTPLNAILGFSQLLESDTETPLTEEQKENVDYIISGGRHLLALINQVLELSAIEARQVQLNIESIDIQKLADEVLPLINTLADKTSIQIHVLPNKSFSIKADYTALKQIIINLMSNAIKYNKPEGCVCLDWQQVSENSIKISVVDKGLGISEENQKKVFSAFNRLGQEHSGIEGTGIGLMVTKNLVEMMQGNIGFSSTLGEGSTFWVELPLKS